MTWEEMYNLTRMYVVTYGIDNLKESFKTKDGITYDEDGYDIFAWLNDQIMEYRKKTMSYKKAKKIKQLNIFKNSRTINRDKKWEEMYNLAKNYYEHNGNLDIPIDFKTKDGITYNKDGKNLRSWINNQRHKKRNNILSVDKVSKLNSIHIIWKSNNKKWNKMYDLAKKNYEKYGCCVPIMSNDFDKERLKNWIYEQQISYEKGTLSQSKINNLKQIGIIRNFALSNEDLKWNINYDLLKKYKENYNSINIPVDFKTKDGITYDEEGINLYRWIFNQKTEYNNRNLKKYKIEKLEQIGIVWNVNNYKWREMYKLVINYYSNKKNLNIPNKFRTKDGITYDEDGKDLCLWLTKQIKLYKNNELSKDRKDKIDKIITIYNCSRNLFINRKITKKNLFEVKKQLLELMYIKLDEYNDKSFNTKEDIEKINKDYVKVFLNNK